jgi:hypothetical protein
VGSGTRGKQNDNCTAEQTQLNLVLTAPKDRLNSSVEDNQLLKRKINKLETSTMGEVATTWPLSPNSTMSARQWSALALLEFLSQPDVTLV